MLFNSFMFLFLLFCQQYPQIHATDADIGLNAVLSYTLTGSNTSLFVMDAHTGELRVTQSLELDRELVGVVILEVRNIFERKILMY